MTMYGIPQDELGQQQFEANAMEQEEITKKTQEILAELSMALVSRDADKLSFYSKYTATDVMNALEIFNCVASNYGIKNGRITSEKDAEIFGKALANVVFNMTGIDTKTFYKK
jgi:hypothetical protein